MWHHKISLIEVQMHPNLLLEVSALKLSQLTKLNQSLNQAEPR